MNMQVVFSKRAFNAIVTEVIDKNPLETGGIFIGYLLDNGIWVVVETIPPGIETINQQAYFEYDANFINYLANVIAQQYKGNLFVLGLWHRHPGSMDTFSSIDDETNNKFAQESQYGAISALVNCDSKMRLTVYHVDKQCNYTKMNWIVDDGYTIPENLLELRFNNVSELPILGRKTNVLKTSNNCETIHYNTSIVNNSTVSNSTEQTFENPATEKSDVKKR